MFDVKDFGARGDGVGDDTVSIQNAINAAVLAKGTVSVPAGTFKLSAATNGFALTVNGDGVTLMLQAGSVLKLASGDGASILYLGDTTNSVQRQALSVIGPGKVDANGIANVTWNLQHGSKFGFAFAVGTYRFLTAQTNMSPCQPSARAAK